VNDPNSRAESVPRKRRQPSIALKDQGVSFSCFEHSNHGKSRNRDIPSRLGFIAERARQIADNINSVVLHEVSIEPADDEHDIVGVLKCNACGGYAVLFAYLSYAGTKSPEGSTGVPVCILLEHRVCDPAVCSRVRLDEVIDAVDGSRMNPHPFPSRLGPKRVVDIFGNDTALRIGECIDPVQLPRKVFVEIVVREFPWAAPRMAVLYESSLLGALLA
jgi:hypothetical protein